MTDRSMSSGRGYPIVSSSEDTQQGSSESSASTNNDNFSSLISFERPFDDHRLEPLPLREEPKGHPPNPSVADQFVLATEAQRSRDSIQVNLDHEEDLGGISRDDSTCWSSSEHGLSGLVGDRSDAFRSEHMVGSQPSSSSAPEESVARFRPYQDEKWQASFQRLLEFNRKFGHCCVPHSYTEDEPLARWVKRQRHQYKMLEENDPKSTLTSSRLEQLEAIGFVWHSHAASWTEKLNELKAFRERKGHCNVPSTYPENVALSTWVKSQRRQYKLYVSGSPSTMTTLRFQVLKSLGFLFEPRLGASSKNGGLELKRGPQDGGKSV